MLHELSDVPEGTRVRIDIKNGDDSASTDSLKTKFEFTDVGRCSGTRLC